MSTQINILNANPYTITGGLFAQTAALKAQGLLE